MIEVNQTQDTTTEAEAEESSQAQYIFVSVDNQDPFARFLRDILKLDAIKFWLVALFIYGPMEKLIIPGIDGYLNLSESILSWTPHIESLFTGFIAFPFFLAFYLWSGRGIPRMFTSLIDNKSFKDVQAYQNFLDRVKVSYERLIWPLLSLVIAIIIVLLMHFVNWGPDAVVPPWFGDRLYARLISLFLVGVVVYGVAQVVLRVILVIYWLQRLWKEMGDNLVIHPYAVDGCGGLDAIGRISVYFFYFVLIFMLWILLATILPAFLATDVKAGLDLDVRLWSPLILVSWVIYLILVPVLFFALIWPTHQVMSRVRNQRLKPLADELDKQLKQAEKEFNNAQVDMEKHLKKLTNTKKMYEFLEADLPAWPMSKQTRRLFNVTPILPTIYSAITFAVGALL